MRAPKINGWYRAAAVVFPAVTLASVQDETRCREVNQHLWTPEGPEDVLEVQILLGDANSEAPAIISDTGVLITRVDLRRDLAVAVVAQARVMDTYTRRVVEAHRALPTLSHRQAPRFGWGPPGGVPGLIDLAG